jgi:hypothetical protein
MGEKLQEIYFFFSWYVRYCMYFFLASQVHCTLIDYAYI